MLFLLYLLCLPFLSIPALFSLGHIVSLKIHYSLKSDLTWLPTTWLLPWSLASTFRFPVSSDHRPTSTATSVTHHWVLLDILTCMPFFMSALPGMSLLPFLLKSFPLMPCEPPSRCPKTSSFHLERFSLLLQKSHTLLKTICWGAYLTSYTIVWLCFSKQEDRTLCCVWYALNTRIGTNEIRWL